MYKMRCIKCDSDTFESRTPPSSGANGILNIYFTCHNCGYESTLALVERTHPTQTDFEDYMENGTQEPTKPYEDEDLNFTKDPYRDPDGGMEP